MPPKLARIKISPKMTARLQAGETALYRIPESVQGVYISLEKPSDSSSVDGLFNRLFKDLFKNW